MIHSNITPQELQQGSIGTMVDQLGIEFLEVSTSHVKAKMPVDHRTIQPYGLLHGGASVALAETLGSIAAQINIDGEKYAAVGLEINANHVRGMREGFVIGTATPLHIGRSTHIWETKITDDQERLVCVSRLTVAIIKK